MCFLLEQLLEHLVSLLFCYSLAFFVSNYKCLKQDLAPSGMCVLNFLETDKTMGARTGWQTGDFTLAENLWSGWKYHLGGFQPIPQSNLWKAHNCWSWQNSLPSLFSVSAFPLYILLSSYGLNSYKQELSVYDYLNKI